MVKDITELNARKDAIKAKIAVAKTQEKLNKIGASIEGAAANMSAFDKMEEKANRMFPFYYICQLTAKQSHIQFLHLYYYEKKGYLLPFFQHEFNLIPSVPLMLQM